MKDHRITILSRPFACKTFLSMVSSRDILLLSGFIRFRVSVQDVSALFISVHTALLVLYVIFFAHILHQLQCTFLAFVVTAH
jgi:hypothetical protein